MKAKVRTFTKAQRRRWWLHFLVVALMFVIPLMFVMASVKPVAPSPTPTTVLTATPTLPPQLPSGNLPAIKADNARLVVSLAWMAHCGTGLGLAWSPDGKTLALVGSGSVAGNVCLYDTASLDTPARILGGPDARQRHSIAFSPSGKIVASGGDDGLIWLWDAATGDQIEILGGYYAAITGISFSPEGDE